MFSIYVLYKYMLLADEDNLPTMKSLQASLLDEDEHDEYSKLLCDLLALGVGDPGFANPREVGLNSLTTGRFQRNFSEVIFQLILVIDGWSTKMNANGLYWW